VTGCYLIFCEWDYYCQGWDDTYGYFLVTADTFSQACAKVVKHLEEQGMRNVRGFENRTVD